jgi:hypothetical protein
VKPMQEYRLTIAHFTGKTLETSSTTVTPTT